MPDFIIRELYGRSPQVLENNNVHVPRTTERMKQMYSSLVSDSEESSSCVSICSENSTCSVSSNEKGERESAIHIAIAPILNTVDYTAVVSPTRKISGKSFARKRLCYENEHEMESKSHEPAACTPNKVAICISPIQSFAVNNKGEIDHEVRSTYYETVQAKERQSQSNYKESSLQKNLGEKHQQSSTSTRKLTLIPAKDPRRDNTSSLQKSALGKAEVQIRHSSPRQRGQSTLECRNPYYRSVQDTLEATGEIEVVIYGKSPFNSDNQKIHGRRLQDDDQRTLLTVCSETVTLISGDASHSNMTETGTVQSGKQDYGTGLCLPISATFSPVKTNILKKVGTESGKLCPRVEGRAEATEVDHEYLTNNKYLDSRGADEGSIAESTLMSLSSDKVVTSTDNSGESVDVGEVPRDISFCHPKPVEYTSLRDLMSNTHKNEKCRKVSRSAEMNSSLGETACARDSHARNHDEQCVEDNKKDSKLIKKDVGRCTSLRPLQDVGFTPESIFEREYLPQDHAERSSRVSNAANLQRNPSFSDEEKSISDISIRDDIAIGSIKDLDVFRKARSTDDECNFGFLFGNRSKKDECKCTIM